MEQFDLRPSPKVLVALTHTPMKPIDALCELIDNAIDSFMNNALRGNDSAGINEIIIDLPTSGEINNGKGVIRVSDNGPGMLADEAKKALTAGESNQYAYGSLGLFGVGLNISAGKFARKTRLITATQESDQALVVEVDIEKLVEQKHYGVNPNMEPKSNYFGGQASGTIIELSNWWRPGSPNSENPKKLIQNGPGKIREVLGRRYATLLRDDSKTKFKLTVKGEACTPFEHCVWSAKRFVKRGSEQIPAMQKFDKLLRTSQRCMQCGELALEEKCPIDESHSIISVEEKVRGWIGVQRFDDVSHFGVDLIRNGRTIRVLEQDAFFTFISDEGERIKDYPIDGIYGRIVGEVHLDHVRVDFTKQDFDRSTSEWQRAMEFLRGSSSLQPSKPGASKNDSPVMRIFTGYRRVRNIGLPDLYMGELRPGDDKPKRNRDIEGEFRERFHAKEPGYYDDAKWFEKVEKASHKPDSFELCPECETQNPSTSEKCVGCGCLLKPKECIKCSEKIPQSASQCDACGASQVPEGPWHCNVCEQQNTPDVDECTGCGEAKGAVNQLSPDILLRNSSKDEGLSIQGVEIELPNMEVSEKFTLEVRTSSLRSGGAHLPAMVSPDIVERKLLIFIDKSHPIFQDLQVRIEHAVALEAAAFISREISVPAVSSRKHEYNLTSLQSKLLDKYWRSELSDNPDEVRQEIHSLLDDVRAKVIGGMQDLFEDIFNDMPNSEQKQMVSNMQESNVDISEMGELKQNGAFLHHVPPETMVAIFRKYPERFFDKNVWKDAWSSPELSDEAVKHRQDRLKEGHLNCLEDGVGFLRYKKNPARATSRRARLSVEILQQELVD